MSKPTATDLFMPKEDIDNSPPLPKSLALTLLLDDHNKIYYYNGDFTNVLNNNEIFETSYSTYDGIGKAIRQKQKELELSGKFDGKRSLMLLIKPTSKANYKNVVDALDEVMINDVRRYAIVEPSIDELNFIKNKIESGF